MNHELIHFKKNNFSILVIYLNNINVNYFKDFLIRKIEEFPVYFHNKPIILDIENLSYPLNWINIKRFIVSIGLFLIGVIGCSNKSLKNIILKSGLPILHKNKNITENICNHLKNQKKDRPSLSPSVNNQKSYLVDYLVRSGQTIYAPNSDLIITNNVSSGAELIAGGNVHIYSIMRGRVLAGANGDITKKIFCMRLFAELISISGEYLTIEQIPIKFLGTSVEISLVNKTIFIKRLMCL